jgi:hypothetical protein
MHQKLTDSHYRKHFSRDGVRVPASELAFSCRAGVFICVAEVLARPLCIVKGHIRRQTCVWDEKDCGCFTSDMLEMYPRVPDLIALGLHGVSGMYLSGAVNDIPVDASYSIECVRHRVASFEL